MNCRQAGMARVPRRTCWGGQWEPLRVSAGQGGAQLWPGDLPLRGQRAPVLARLSGEVGRGPPAPLPAAPAPGAACLRQRWMGWAGTQEEVGLESSLLTPAEIYGAAARARWGCHSANVIGTRWRWQGGDRGRGEAGAWGPGACLGLEPRWSQPSEMSSALRVCRLCPPLLYPALTSP